MALLLVLKERFRERRDLSLTARVGAPGRPVRAQLLWSPHNLSASSLHKARLTHHRPSLVTLSRVLAGHQQLVVGVHPAPDTPHQRRHTPEGSISRQSPSHGDYKQPADTSWCPAAVWRRPTRWHHHRQSRRRRSRCFRSTSSHLSSRPSPAARISGACASSAASGTMSRRRCSTRTSASTAETWCVASMVRGRKSMLTRLRLQQVTHLLFRTLSISPPLCRLMQTLEMRVYPLSAKVLERLETEKLVVEILKSASNLRELRWTRKGASVPVAAFARPETNPCRIQVRSPTGESRMQDHCKRLG